jgi:hypothetical protein
MEAGWICVFTTTFEHLAELVHAQLTEHGIEAVVMNKKDSSYLSFGQLEVYVPETDHQTAEALILSLDL